MQMHTNTAHTYSQRPGSTADYNTRMYDVGVSINTRVGGSSELHTLKSMKGAVLELANSTSTKQHTLSCTQHTKMTISANNDQLRVKTQVEISWR